MGFDTEKFTHEFPFIFRPSSEAAGKLLGLVTALEEQDISSPPDFFGWELVQTGDEDEPWIPESYNWRGECACNWPHYEGAEYWVTAKNEKGQVAFLLGPFDDHAIAITKITEGTELAYLKDPKAPWYYYGTSAVRKGYSEGNHELLR